MSIRRHELAGQGAKAQALKTSLKKRYKERGNRIYVLYSTGLLDEFMGFMLGWIAYAGTLSDRLQAIELWNKCLDDMEYGIFVNRHMSEDDILSGLTQRFRIERLPVVLIFGRTPGIISKIRNAVREFLESEDDRQIERITYEVDFRDYSVGDHEVLVTSVKADFSSLPCKGSLPSSKKQRELGA